MFRRQSALWFDDLVVGVAIGVGLITGITGVTIGVRALASWLM
jgi:hypothetical protein